MCQCHSYVLSGYTVLWSQEHKKYLKFHDENQLVLTPRLYEAMAIHSQHVQYVLNRLATLDLGTTIPVLVPRTVERMTIAHATDLTNTIHQQFLASLAIAGEQFITTWDACVEKAATLPPEPAYQLAALLTSKYGACHAVPVVTS